MPTISIVIPAFNRGFVIRRTLDSVSQQTFFDWECIIVDDGSTDDTKNIVAEYVEKDNRFSICDNTRKKGAQGARNTGILKAQGEWILLFDSDDVMHSDYLEKMVPHLNAGQNIVVCYGQMIEESSGKRLQVMKKMESGNIYRKLLSGKNYLTYNCSLIKKKCFIQIGLLDENCPSHQEWDTHVRLSSKYEYTVVPEVLWDYFVGREDTISFDMKKHVKGLLYIIRKNYFIYRFQAYRSFLIRMRNLWVFTKKFEESKMTFRLKILFLAPELPIYLLFRKCKQNNPK